MNEEDIREKAAKSAEARVYEMTNPYLNREEKYEVELWYQSPGDIMWIVFLTLAVSILNFGLDMSYLKALVVSWLVGTAITILNWFVYKQTKFIWNILYKLFFNIMVQAIGVIVGIWLIINGQLIWGGISLLSVVGIMAIIEPQTILYGVFASFKYSMHPKYAFFKRFYSKSFPFEENG